MPYRFPKTVSLFGPSAYPSSAYFFAAAITLRLAGVLYLPFYLSFFFACFITRFSFKESLGSFFLLLLPFVLYLPYYYYTISVIYSLDDPKVERMIRIELTPSAWKAEALPICNIRMCRRQESNLRPRP